MADDYPIETIPARGAAYLRLGAGESVRVINTHGAQVVDTWAFGSEEPGEGPLEHMSMEHSRVGGGFIVPSVGDEFLSNLRRPMLRLAHDTSGGPHDTLCAACDPARYRSLGWDGPHANCADNLRAMLVRLGLERPDRPAPAPCPLNLFQNTPPRADGRLVIEAPKARKGGHVTLSALMDLTLVFSACPMDLTDTNGAERQPREAHFQRIGAP